MAMNRRVATKLIAAAASGGTILKAPAVWSQANVTKIRVGVVPVLDAGAFIAAQAQGYFAAERLEIEVTPTPGGGPAMAAVVADQFQLAMSTITTMIAGVAEGVDLRIVAPTSIAKAPPNDYSGIMVRRDGSVRSGADVNGKTGASHLLQNLLWICLRAWVDATGGDSAKNPIIEVRFPQQADALMQGRVDYVASIEPFMSAQVQANPDKLELVSGLCGRMMPNTVVAAFAATQTYIDRNKEIINAFARAHKKGAAWCEQNKGNTAHIELIAKFTQLQPERLRGLLAWPEYPQGIDAAILDRIAQGMTRYGMLTSIPAASSYLHETART